MRDRCSSRGRGSHGFLNISRHCNPPPSAHCLYGDHCCSPLTASVVSDSFRPHGLYTAPQASLSFTIAQSSLRLTSIESVMPSSHLILCRPLLLLPSVFPSIRVFSSESALHIEWPKYWSFSFSISPCSEYSGLISFRIDWSDLLAVQGTLQSLLQYQFSSILWFTVRLHRAMPIRCRVANTWLTSGVEE